MEIAQQAYLETEAPPWAYDETRAETLRHTLKTILHSLAEAALELTR
jgi:formiminoglutamase